MSFLIASGGIHVHLQTLIHFLLDLSISVVVLHMWVLVPQSISVYLGIEVSQYDSMHVLDSCFFVMLCRWCMFPFLTTSVRRSRYTFSSSLL